MMNVPMGNGYMRSFPTREEALAHAVEKNLEADSPLASFGARARGRLCCF
jgi:hypothetical protein